jgi:DNA-binding transcriptional LysR family regulator
MLVDIRRLTVHQLRTLLAVARHRNFTRAAEDLGLSQPAVSAQIREMTDILGVPLFEKFGKTIHLTDAGRILEGQASRIDGLFDEIRRDFTAFREGGKGSVRVGGSTSIGTYFLPSLIAGFSKRHPGIQVSLAIENTAHIEEMMLRNGFDVGFLGGAVASRELEAAPVLKDEIFFAAAPLHPLASRKPLDPRRLSEEKLFVREPGSATRKTMEDYCSSRAITLGKSIQLGSVEAIKQAVMAGLGISYFSSLTVRTEIAAGRLARLKVKGVGLRRDFFLVRHRRKRETPALRVFRDFAARCRR